MNRINHFCQKQATILLKNEHYAWLLVVILTVVPFFEWFALAIIILITLRKGSYEGFKVFGIGMLISSALLFNADRLSLPYSAYDSLLTICLGYVTAIALRYTVNWNFVMTGLLIVGLICTTLINWIAPAYVFEQYQLLIALFKINNSSLLELINTKLMTNKVHLANYLLGIKTLSIIVSVLSSLMLARTIQDRLFYPGGFRKEILSFKANNIGIILLILSVFGSYEGNLIAISCLPLLVVYAMIAGMIVLFNLLHNQRDFVSLCYLVIPLILIPYIMLPIYVLLGSLDSIFNFRLRLTQVNKG